MYEEISNLDIEVISTPETMKCSLILFILIICHQFFLIVQI